ncbi:hypothetical protein CONLIGDRAFT_78232 [Coniochaeta ligniaria NRRL 30616]|uniref:Uncharacterized protein n=1 Tax=Coniochaeta ligniaria NRRL 30616 TaxID=1408157 RepID=A0A1J7IV94_9PEZI|nr:hypothetical protein CONLIGDRAFT_78232 [Coniochaeta ligniaria NRRL 30616]
MCNQDILNQTYRTATSKTAQRTLLNTVLLTSASAILYAFAALAYIIFYNAYLPDQVTTLPIHLQYGYGPNPYGVSPLPSIKDYQAYDISVSLTLPRSPTNIDRGNFMIALHLLDRPGTAISPPAPDLQHPADTTPASLFPPPDPRTHLSTRRILHTSHRPALIPYTDPIVSLAYRLLFLPGHILFPSSSRASTTSLTIPLAESLSFPVPKGPKSVPSSLFLELQSGQSLRVSAASVTITAQLSGLRWLMHTYRVSSFIAGTTAFWGCEVAFMAAAWLALSTIFSGPAESDRTPKLEAGEKERKKIAGEYDMSDTERTFPTTSRAPPLKYESVKEEDVSAVSMAELPVAAGGEADDEDDDGGEGWRDSGIGTSYSDAGAAVGGVRRRASGKGR